MPKKSSEIQEDEALPEGTNVALLRDFDEATQRMRANYVDSENHYGEQTSIFAKRNL